MIASGQSTVIVSKVSCRPRAWPASHSLVRSLHTLPPPTSQIQPNRQQIPSLAAQADNIQRSYHSLLAQPKRCCQIITASLPLVITIVLKRQWPPDCTLQMHQAQAG